jgi:hypothetical protein
MGNKELDDIMKKKFKGYSNRALLDRANKKGENDQNDDDELYEMARRKDLGKMNFKAGWDRYELIE